jgi:hypothetical protein
VEREQALLDSPRIMFFTNLYSNLQEKLVCVNTLIHHIVQLLQQCHDLKFVVFELLIQ